MVEAVSTSETSVNFYQTTRCNIPEDRHLLTRRRENLKSRSSLWWWRQYSPLKRRSISTELHGATSQKTVIFILAAVRNRSDDGGSTHLWNVGQFLPDYTAQHPRRRPSSYSLPWESKIILNILDFDAIWRWIFSFTLSLLYPTNSSPGSEGSGEDKHPSPADNRTLSCSPVLLQ
jgi:hypothetical protein